MSALDERIIELEAAVNAQAAMAQAASRTAAKAEARLAAVEGLCESRERAQGWPGPVIVEVREVRAAARGEVYGDHHACPVDCGGECGDGSR